MSDAAKTVQDSAVTSRETRLNQYMQTVAVVIVVVGCYLILHPFIPAVLFAAVVCSSTWPLYVMLRKALRLRATLAALVMTLMLILLVVGPAVLLAVNLADTLTVLAEATKEILASGPIKPPAWVREIPVLGGLLADFWQRLATSSDSLATLWKSLLQPVQIVLIGAGKAAGEGLLQLSLASFIVFFFYRDGEAMMLAVRKGLDQIAADRGQEFLEMIDNSVTGAVTGIFGTALAQALVALAGFVIAGVPAAFLLAVATFFFSIVPIGPPLIWGGAVLWLAHDGQIPWAIFMAAWGLFGISTIDNLAKPYLISRSSKLPMLLIVLGVFGGVVAFGFIGLFIGPPVLAIGLTLVQLWIARRPGDTKAAAATHIDQGIP